MKKADKHLVDEWAAQYPVGTLVEVKYRGWATGVVTRHEQQHGTVYLRVKLRFGFLYFPYGARKDVRAVR